MVDLIVQHREAIVELCKRYGIRKLELFGSAARSDFDASHSDVDFFYEFNDDHTNLADRYFSAIEDLEKMLGRHVDFVSAKDAKNPYFLEVANRDRITLYAA